MKLTDSPKWRGDPPSQLGLRLRKLRVDSRWTQGELGEKMGSKSSQISDWEKGFKTPSLPTLVKYSHIFGMSVSDILSGVL